MDTLVGSQIFTFLLFREDNLPIDDKIPGPNNLSIHYSEVPLYTVHHRTLMAQERHQEDSIYSGSLTFSLCEFGSLSLTVRQAFSSRTPAGSPHMQRQPRFLLFSHLAWPSQPGSRDREGQTRRCLASIPCTCFSSCALYIIPVGKQQGESALLIYIYLGGICTPTLTLKHSPVCIQKQTIQSMLTQYLTYYVP